MRAGASCAGLATLPPITTHPAAALQLLGQLCAFWRLPTRCRADTRRDERDEEAEGLLLQPFRARHSSIHSLIPSHPLPSHPIVHRADPAQPHHSARTCHPPGRYHHFGWLLSDMTYDRPWPWPWPATISPLVGRCAGFGRCFLPMDGMPCAARNLRDDYHFIGTERLCLTSGTWTRASCGSLILRHRRDESPSLAFPPAQIFRGRRRLMLCECMGEHGGAGLGRPGR